MLKKLLVKNYKIVGVTKNDISNWKDEIRDDIPIHILESRTGKIQIRTTLDIINAIKLHFSLYKYNKKHENKLYLEKA